MAKLNIEQTHALPLDEVKKRLQGLADRLSEKYGIHSQWKSEREAEIKRTGVTGKITMDDSKVTVALDLSFMLNPLKEKIEERVRHELEKALG
jgi:putative polyhydroxyalkanoate system protein